MSVIRRHIHNNRIAYHKGLISPDAYSKRNHELIDQQVQLYKQGEVWRDNTPIGYMPVTEGTYL